MGMMPGMDRTKTSKWWISLIIIAVAGMVLSVDLYTPIGGNIRFYSKWAECGNRPYEGHILPIASRGYYVQSPAIGIFRDYVQHYYCTPHEAELDGLSASYERYEFPHLSSEERSHIKDRFNIP